MENLANTMSRPQHREYVAQHALQLTANVRFWWCEGSRVDLSRSADSR
jgi:hypothetical protein